MSLRPPTPTNASVTKNRMIGKVITTAPTYRPMINVPDARLAITSWGPERPSRTPRRVRRENLIGVSSGSRVVVATAAHFFPAVSTSVESATGGGTVEGAADSCACA